jgi:predicted transcriptional regulator
MIEKLEDVLTELGFSRTFSITLAFLIQHREATARQIEKATELRQPETSKSLGSLHLLNWVTVKKQGRTEGQIGKTGNVYQIIPLDKLYAEIERKELASLKVKEAALGKLETAMISPEPVVNEKSTDGQQLSLIN